MPADAILTTPSPPTGTPLGNVIQFFQDLGVYEVVLPFLLTFTIVYSILDRSRVLGVDVFDKVTYPKKNLNAMTSFVIAFLVVASAQLVEIITQVSSQMVILLLLVVFFLLLVGSFYEKGEVGEKGLPGWPRTIFLW